MIYVLAVDIQPEFVRGFEGKAVYSRLLDFISRAHIMGYTVIAPVYQNKSNPNMNRLVGWNEMQQIRNLEFKPDYIYLHSGYSIREYPEFNPNDFVIVVGFDTDACVLSACFDLFNLGVNFTIIEDGCFSSGGRDMHNAGCKVMKRQFGKAFDAVTKLREVNYG